MTSRNAFPRGPTAAPISYPRFTPPGNSPDDDVAARGRSFTTPRNAPDDDVAALAREARDALARAREVLSRHVEQPLPPSAKPDPGVILAEIERGDGTTMRVCWRLFEGRPFVSIAVWGDNGWPVKGKQTTLKLRELAAVIDGLVAAVEKRVGGTE